MSSTTAIAVRYWAAQDGATSLYDLKGIDDFRTELAEHYVSYVKGRPGDLGGLYNLSVEIVSTLALSHVLRLVLDGIAFDLIKEGMKAFVLRPFLAAYKRLRERNADDPPDIEELRLIFQDAVVTIDCLGHDTIASSLEGIVKALAANFDRLRLNTSETPFEIHIPVFEDPADDRPSRFRVLLDVDEAIPSVSAEDYFRYWGLWYDFSRQHRVYDLARQLLIDET